MDLPVGSPGVVRAGPVYGGVSKKGKPYADHFRNVNDDDDDCVIKPGIVTELYYESDTKKSLKKVAIATLSFDSVVVVVVGGSCVVAASSVVVVVVVVDKHFVITRAFNMGAVESGKEEKDSMREKGSRQYRRLKWILGVGRENYGSVSVKLSALNLY